ncbi:MULTISPECIES: GntR family transcriptional regulator [Micromonospora]|uniref:GntR family transcriptional regulator n=1 Tax=Micromonospora TaxID=1873 RepID=UPI000206AC40|nr:MULTISPECIES: GntR family transcriptional regulator [Micromonospora]AEB46666.1 transcriptional regulator, GntR family protein [Micromonospora maris AB-18-032]
MERSGAAGVMDDGRPIFQQIAELLESSILDGTLAEESQVPSTNELAAFHRINPATAAKGVNKLVDDGTLYKKRGIGMFVSSGARAKLRARRRDEFARQYVQPLVAEARKLGIDPAELKHMIDNWEETR